jgi:ParB/RepB/Spo0J family partition protein
MKVPINKIVVPEVRASSRLTDDQRAFFEASVKKYCVLQDILVRPLPDGRYELIAGKTRLEEQIKQGMKEVEAKVIDATGKDAAFMHLIENVARGSVDPISVARVMQQLIDQGTTLEEIAGILNHTPEWVKLRLLCLKMPEEYQEDLKSGRLKIGHIEQVARLPTPQEVGYALDLTRSLNWDVATLRLYTDRGLREIPKEAVKAGLAEPPELPSKQRAVEMVTFTTCSACRRAIHKKELRMPPLCEGCLYLVQYCTSQFGPPKQAMEYIYQAVRHYQTFLEAQERILLRERQRQVLPTPADSEPASTVESPTSEIPESPETPSPHPTQEAAAAFPEKPRVIEDDELRSFIKRTVREELKRQR